jgi:2-hydroxy-3-oxopropionate reductase
MGGAIAGALVDAGIDLHVFDISSVAVDKLAGLGATPQRSARSVADIAEVVCTCLASKEAAEAVLFGEEGLAKGSAIRTLVEMSTLGSPAVSGFAAALADKQISVVDAPVSGGAADTAAGKLVIMVAGSDAAVQAVMPVLGAVTSRIKRVGTKPGQGQLMKLINNLLAGANLTAAVEALALGARLGLDQAAMLELITMSSGQSRILEKKGPAIVSRRFAADSGGHIGILAKDFRLAVEDARLAGVSLAVLPTLAGAHAVWESAMNQGLGQRKIPELITVIEASLADASSISKTVS